MLSLDTESTGSCVMVSKTEMVRVKWKLQRNISSKEEAASGSRLSLTRVSGMAFVVRDIYLMCNRENTLQLARQSCNFLGQHKIY